MMKNKVLALSIIAVLISFSGFSQKKMKVDGSFKGLKSAKTINLEFDYSNMGVEKYADEQEYVDDMVAKRNEKEPGTGDKWREKWVEDRSERFEPKFIELFNKYLAERGVSSDIGNESAPITVIVRTTYTEPGFNVGVVRKPAHINVEVVFKEKTSNKTIGTMTMRKVPGRDAMGYDFDTGYRLQEAYAKLGKEVGKYLIKKVI